MEEIERKKDHISSREEMGIHEVLNRRSRRRYHAIPDREVANVWIFTFSLCGLIQMSIAYVNINYFLGTEETRLHYAYLLWTIYFQ